VKSDAVTVYPSSSLIKFNPVPDTVTEGIVLSTNMVPDVRVADVYDGIVIEEVV
jgi:hypothetical protein